MSLPPEVVLASTFGVSLCAFFTGGNYTSSFHGLKAVLLPPSGSKQLTTNVTVAHTGRPVSDSSHLARQRQLLYDLGMPIFAPMCVIAAAAFGYCAYQLPKSLVFQKQLYTVAVVLNLCVGPFTWVVMKNTNGELKRRAKLAEKGAEEDFAVGHKRSADVRSYETGDLVQWWGSLNAIRATLPLLAMVVAMTAMVT